MKPYLPIWQFARVVAVVVMAVVVALALVHSRRGEETPGPRPMARGKAEVGISDLTRCRAVAPGETEQIASCRRIWAENREHFFASSTPSQQTLGAAAQATFSGNRLDDVPPNGIAHVGRR